MHRNVTMKHHRRHLYRFSEPHVVCPDIEHLPVLCHVTQGQGRASFGISCTPTIVTVASWR